MPRHAHGRETPIQDSADTSGGRASHRRRRRRRRTPRTLLAVCATVLAAGAGGVFSGVLPLPPGVPASLVVAGDPAGRQPVARSTTPAATPAATGRPGGGAPSAPAPHRTTAAPSSTARVSPRPSATGSPAPSAPASPSASGSAGQTGAPAPAATVADDQSRVLALVNTQRAQHGCAALTRSQPLTTLAQNFSAEMAARNFFDHTDPDGKSPWDRAKILGITNLGGENIAMGQQSPDEVMTAWMNSAGHRANILNCSYHSLGVGVFRGSGGGPWWTQDFGF